MSCSNCCFLTCIQVSLKTGRMVWYFYFFKNFKQFVVIHTVKGFSVEVDVFLEFHVFLYDPTNVGNLISSSSAFSKPNLYVWKFLVHTLLKPSLKDFEYKLTNTWNEHKCMIVWTFFGIGMNIDVFQSCGHCWVFQICWHVECSTLTASSFRNYITALTKVMNLLPQMNLYGSIIITYSPQFTLWLTLGVVESVDLNKCIITCIHHYGIIQSMIFSLS